MDFLSLVIARKKVDMVCNNPFPFFATLAKTVLYIGTSKPYAPGTVNSLSTFGFRGEGRVSHLFSTMLSC